MVKTIHILTLIQHTCSKTRGDVWQLSVIEIYFEVNHKKYIFLCLTSVLFSNAFLSVHFLSLMHPFSCFINEHNHFQSSITHK